MLLKIIFLDSSRQFKISFLSLFLISIIEFSKLLFNLQIFIYKLFETEIIEFGRVFKESIAEKELNIEDKSSKTNNLFKSLIYENNAFGNLDKYLFKFSCNKLANLFPALDKNINLFNVSLILVEISS